jgi:two-component system chemotaxis sensor kinase CheA
MAKNKNAKIKSLRTANVSSVLLLLILSAAYFFQMRLTDIAINYPVAIVIMAGGLLIVVSIIRNTINHYKLAFNVPFVMLLTYTALMMLCGWYLSYYLLVCLALCAISCIYSSFHRTVIFIIIQNALIGFFVLRGTPLAGLEADMLTILINWAVCLFGSILMLVITRYATVVLDRALEHQSSFANLLLTMENFVAMINDRNEVVYASKTLSQLGGVEDPTLVQGRPLIDLFPGKSLKIYAGSLLKEKDNYAEDWEFNLNGQKRYFKAGSHRLMGGSGGALISLYDMTHLAERDEIAAMKDSMQIGLFFMDSNYVIQDHYSRYLEVLLMEENLFGKVFTDMIADSVNPNELEAIKDYFGMVLERSYDQEMLVEINPLNELHYVSVKTKEKKVLQCTFSTIEKDRGEVHLLVTVYDITERVELQKRLAEEEARRQEEMQSVFELIQVEPDVFSDFMEDMEHEFGEIDKILKNEELSAREALVKVYQSVHAIKSNAVILGLNVFGNKAHNLESKIKKLRDMEKDVPFNEMLNLTMEIENISQEREGFKDILDKLQSYAGGGGSGGGQKQAVKVMIDSLQKTVTKASEDMEKQTKFLTSEVNPEAINVGPRRVMKEILMQLIRNSVVHGIEKPVVRKTKGKNETGIIKLTITISDDKKHIHMKLMDDGRGLDYKKIAEKAIDKKILTPEQAKNPEFLQKAIFAPGFSTAATETVHGGRGIGLNLVRDRTKEVGGTIKLRSETGKGTMFFVSLPIHAEKSA